MNTDTCDVYDCHSPRRRRRNPYCATHYRRLSATGRLDLKTTEERYEEKVDRSGGPDACHPWTASCNKAGYGLFGHDGETLAARWAYKRFVGPLGSNEQVRHTCDNPPCQDRRHWLSGSNLDNQMDKLERNRQHRPSGRRNPKAVLTEDLVVAIRAESTGAYGEQTRLAAKYGVSQPTISSILRGATWRSPVSA